jgi:carboxyl-terminal processing protease
MKGSTMKFDIFAISAVCALLTACGGGGSSEPAGPAIAPAAPKPAQLTSGYPSDPVSCDAPGQRAWLRDYMNDQYLWYNQQGTPDVAATTPAQYFDSLLFVPLDRYSFSQSSADFAAFFGLGQTMGYGYALAWADTAQTVLKVRLVEPQSPIGRAGLRRGDTVVSIDGYTPEQIVNGLPPRATTAGVARKFVVVDAAGRQQTFNVSSAVYPLSPVLDARVLAAPNGAKVGYLAYQEFITSGADAVGAAFDRFAVEGITELVLDLRYNGGGSTTQARNLASLAAGSALNGKVFADYRFSAKNADSNFTQPFNALFAARASARPSTPLENLRRVFVITSGSTASASELLINGLRAFMPVVTVGSTTFGKPYGFLPRDACGITYNAVNFVTANAVGFSDYSAGFAPTCAVADDLSRQFGDPAEERTAAALHYISGGACPVTAAVNRATLPGASNGIATASRRRNELGFGEVRPPQARLD